MIRPLTAVLHLLPQVLKKDSQHVEAMGMWDVLRRGTSQALFSDLTEVAVPHHDTSVQGSDCPRWFVSEDLLDAALASAVETFLIHASVIFPPCLRTL